jgi:hypothetical protein
MDAPHKIDQMVGNGVAPFLKTFGFSRRRNAFCRAFAHGFDLLGLQKSSWNDKKSARFTINLGVCWVEAQRLLGHPVKGVPFSADVQGSTVFRRIGDLMPEQRDFWWDVRSDGEVDAVQLDLLERLDLYAIPWLETAHDLERSIALSKEYRFPRHVAVLESLRSRIGQQGASPNCGPPASAAKSGDTNGPQSVT